MSKYLRVSKQLQLAEPAPSTAKFFESISATPHRQIVSNRCAVGDQD